MNINSTQKSILKTLMAFVNLSHEKRQRAGDISHELSQSLKNITTNVHSCMKKTVHQDNTDILFLSMERSLIVQNSISVFQHTHRITENFHLNQSKHIFDLCFSRVPTGICMSSAFISFMYLPMCVLTYLFCSSGA
jgi:hypothetical protein